MTLDVNSDTYIIYEKQAKRGRAIGKEWSEIYSLECENDEKLKEKLDSIALQHCADQITIDEWIKIVDNVKIDEENGRDTTVILPQVMIPGNYVDKYKVNNHKGSAWKTYKEVLNKKEFEKSTIDTIENSSIHILNKLSGNTINDGPVKGLVIGSVQSGKTANMAGLMAMAADAGFNMFIIMSGTIENLRRQTQNRLRDDLGSATNVSWTLLDNVNTDRNYPHPLRSIQVNPESKQRYFMVCLKNSKRLSNLLNWLSDDLNKREQLKILLIDDEADQAGINTADISEKERTKINDLLVKIVTNKNEKGDLIEKPYQAMNYVGYTATPYANILNESPGDDSLYPSDFVACLETSNSYFGPQHIFGLQELDMDGMDIINNIEPEDIELLKGVNKGDCELPKSLCDALYWFYCTFAIRRHDNIHKPVSMLIHTSPKQADHINIYNSINTWFNNHDWSKFEDECRKIYNEQTEQFIIKKFADAYPRYTYTSKLKNYPNYDEIIDDLKFIFDNKIKQIKLSDKDGHLEFSKGVHLCIDNCAHNGINDENEILRLFYPNEDNPVDYTTGFIVIGGATLSRGLTIEGLTCSYFLRTVKTADTLMQMGRWFGYRKGYELLPRIWISDSTKKQYEFLAILDYELRKEMKEMEVLDIKPSMVGIKVMNNPNKRFLDITSNRKMQGAIEVEVDYSGLITQTTIFYEDEDILKNNYDNSLDFIYSLGKPIDLTNHIKTDYSYVWENISDEIILNYLRKMKFPKNTNTFLDIELFSKSYEILAKENGIKGWNVVLAGVSKADAVSVIDFGGLKVSTVNRSKKENKIDDGLIRIGALRNIRDLYVDIDITNKNLTEDDIKSIKTSKSDKCKLIRRNAGLNDKSLLIVYVIDHDSIPRDKPISRVKMNTKHDVIGLTMLIPESKDGVNKGSKVMVDIKDINNDFGEAEA